MIGKRRIAAAFAILAAGTVVSLASPGTAHASPVTSRTAVTTLVDRPDSGNGGDWADDYVSRMLTITLTGITGSGPSKTWHYAAYVKDNGWFYTIDGALTPNQSGPYTGQRITGTAIGLMAGYADFYFTASQPFSTRANLGLPAYEAGNPATTAEQTSYWFEQAFPHGTVFGGPGIGEWSWTYVTFAPLPNGQRWIDAWNNGYGDSPGDGNISV